MRSYIRCSSSLRTPLIAVLTFLLLIIISASVTAQVSNEYLLKMKPVLVKQVTEKEGLPNTVFLAMDFGSPVINNPEAAAVLNGKTILKIELVYTAFQVSDEFKQPELNKQRLQSLRKLCPYLFRSTSTEWKMIGQNGCRNEWEAKKMYHGFIITYRPDATSFTMLQEMEELEKITNNDSLGKDSVVEITKMRLKRHVTPTGYYKPIAPWKKKAGIVYTKKGIWNRPRQYRVWYDTIQKKVKVPKYIVNKSASHYVSDLYSGGKDTTIMAVLNRNKQWNDILFVCDVTGSMSPYSAQLLIWNKLNFNARRAKYFTFFNDGDNKSERQKKIGSIGGIYHTEAGSVQDVETTAKLAMIRGGGGDAPENDIEALMEAMLKCPDAKEIVLIADNWAPIKDIELIEKLHKPVHVIMCGMYGGVVNTDYLELALKTKGSIHTIEEDITGLMKLNEGETFQIGKQTYILKNGRFELVYKL